MNFLRHQEFHIFIASAVALACILFLSDRAILYSIIVFGQAHFLLSYFYSNKSGKVDQAYLRLFFSLLVVIGITCFFVYHNPQFVAWLIFLTSVVFSVHYFSDEFRLSHLDAIRNRLLGTMAVAISFMAVFSVKLFSVGTDIVVLLTVIAVIFATMFLLQYFASGNAVERNLLFLFFFFLNIALPIFFAFRPDMASINQILGFIVLFHYVRWYVYYFERFKGREFNFYMDAVVWAHVFVFLVFIQYMLAPFSGMVYFFFNPIFFYGWTLMHIALTVRSDDYSLVL